MKTPKRNRLRLEKLDELSIVDKPAQAPALVTLLKRDDEEPSDEYGHPLDENGKPMLGHLIKSIPRAQEIPMSDDITKKLESDLARANAIVAMTAEERSYFDKLSGESADGFIAKSATARRADMDADQVVYTAADGTAIRKSMDPTGLLVKFAKERDEADRLAKAAEAKAADVELEKRATEFLKHAKSEVPVLKALVAAVECIPEEGVRKAALALLKAYDETAALTQTEVGTTNTPTPDEAGTPEQKLEALIEKCAEKNGISKDAALSKLLVEERNADAVRLYEEIRAH